MNTPAPAPSPGPVFPQYDVVMPAHPANPSFMQKKLGKKFMGMVFKEMLGKKNAKGKRAPKIRVKAHFRTPRGLGGGQAHGKK